MFTAQSSSVFPWPNSLTGTPKATATAMHMHQQCATRRRLVFGMLQVDFLHVSFLGLACITGPSSDLCPGS